jgi:puromycin-sensitive aminopeptidase
MPLIVGNLVTMEWWTHLWLNEGFASFMEHFCTHDLFPEYNIWTQFVTDTLIPAFQVRNESRGREVLLKGKA